MVSLLLLPLCAHILIDALIEVYLAHDWSDSRLTYMRVVVAGEVLEEQGRIVTEERVPVVSEVELRVVLSCVALVDADQLSVPRVNAEKAS